MSFLRRQLGFSLVELLITVAIVGIMAAFTVPSLINTPNSTANSKYTAVARDTAFMVLSAYEQYRAANTNIPTSLAIADLTQYMNYVKVDTNSTIDYLPGNTSLSCNSESCLRLHNGAILQYASGSTMGTANSQAAIYFGIDPDGKYSGSTNGPGKLMEVWLYYDGRIRTWGTLEPNTRLTWGGSPMNVNPNAAYDPTWFTGF